MGLSPWEATGADILYPALWRNSLCSFAVLPCCIIGTLTRSKCHHGMDVLLVLLAVALYDWEGNLFFSAVIYTEVYTVSRRRA